MEEHSSLALEEEQIHADLPEADPPEADPQDQEPLNDLVEANIFREVNDLEDSLPKPPSHKSKQSQRSGRSDNLRLSIKTVSSRADKLSSAGGKPLPDRSADFDLPQLPNIFAGQSNSNKKSKLAGKVRFPDEDSSSEYTTDSQGRPVKKLKGKRPSQSEGSYGSDKTFSSKAAEARNRKQFERFYPVFKQVEKLRHMRAKGYKPNPSDFFYAYLNGLQKSEEMRQADLRDRDQGFFEQVRKVIEYQDKKTQELLEKLEQRERLRKEQLDERLQNLGFQLYSNYQAEKQRATQTQSLRSEQASKHLRALKVDRLPPLPPFAGLDAIGEMRPSGINQQ